MGGLDWMDWKSLGGGMYRAPYGANKTLVDKRRHGRPSFAEMIFLDQSGVIAWRFSDRIHSI